jgi:hypothetical protein
MYISLTRQEKIDPDYFTIEWDEEDETINMHLNSHVYLAIQKDEWDTLVTEVAKLTFPN